MEFRISGFADEISDDLTVQLESLENLGMKYVEMRGVDGGNLVFHSDAKVKEIKRRLDDHGIALSALGTPFGKIGITDDFDKHFDDFKRGIEIAHKMDCRNIRMFSFYIANGKNAEYRDAVFERMGRFVNHAAVNDVVLLHENEKGIYGEKATECRELMDEFYGEHFKAVFDFANFVQAGQDTLEAYELLKDHIAYIHVKDAIRSDGHVVPAGYGDGNVEEILGRLFADGYSGFLSLEPHLSDFTGFASLEKGSGSVAGAGKKLSGFEAFKTAHDALEQILKKLA